MLGNGSRCLPQPDSPVGHSLCSGQELSSWVQDDKRVLGRQTDLWEFGVSLVYDETLKLGAFPFQPAQRAF